MLVRAMPSLTVYMQYRNIVITSLKCNFVGRDMYFDASLVVAFSCGIVVCAQCPIAPRYIR